MPRSLAVFEPILAWIERSAFLPVYLGLLVLLAMSWRLFVAGRGSRARRTTRIPVSEEPALLPRLCRPKPPWVRAEVLRLKALMPHDGCRTIAFAFRYLHGHQETVGKTFVAETIRGNLEEILRLRREIKHRKPRPLPRNVTWALDHTFLPGRKLPLLAILDHGSRACLFFGELHTKSAIAIARAVVSTARRYGLPRNLRTDNEASFCSFPVRTLLFLLGIRHQRTDPYCPWQNGRVERFFGTFKERVLPRLADLRAWRLEPDRFQTELDTFHLPPLVQPCPASPPPRRADSRRDLGWDEEHQRTQAPRASLLLRVGGPALRVLVSHQRRRLSRDTRCPRETSIP